MSTPRPPLPRALLLACSLLAFVLTSVSANAQAYDTAIGLRVGSSGGLSFAQRLAKRFSIEAHVTAGLFEEGTTVRLLGRHHVGLLGRRFNLFVGGGLHQGFNYEPRREGALLANPFGVNVQVGLEATFGRTNVAFDYLPQLNFGGRAPLVRVAPALTVRYVIDKRASLIQAKLPWNRTDKEKRQRERQKARRKRKKDRERDGRPSLRERIGL